MRKLIQVPADNLVDGEVYYFAVNYGDDQYEFLTWRYGKLAWGYNYKTAIHCICDAGFRNGLLAGPNRVALAIPGQQVALQQFSGKPRRMEIK